MTCDTPCEFRQESFLTLIARPAAPFGMPAYCRCGTLDQSSKDVGITLPLSPPSVDNLVGDSPGACLKARSSGKYWSCQNFVQMVKLLFFQQFAFRHQSA